jgi:hypothetical protein
MATRSPITDFPWRKVAVALIAAVVVAWALGFLAGLIVRLGFGA